jgi:tRNA (guanine26-N2/guanine27-N2)-dimethyltransferase
MRSITHDGIISCTATDTATLCGVYPKVCQRRYNAVPFHSIVMKEIGLRILLGVLCHEACKYDKGIEPLVSYSTDHYFRIYIKVRNGVPHANDSMSNLQIIKTGEHAGYEQVDRDIGPLWIGKLQNKRVIQELRTVLFEKQLETKSEVWKLLDLLEEEADAPSFFYTTDSLASFLKTSPPKMDKFFEKIQKIGYDIFRTHFSTTGFKTDAPKDIIEKVFK